MVLFLCTVAIVLVGARPAVAAPGDADASFSGDGVVTTAVGDAASARAVVVQPDGRIVAAGYTVDGEGRKFALVRFLGDGSLDTSFGGDGVVVTAVGAQVGGAYAGEARDIAIEPDGKLGRSATPREEFSRAASRRW